MEAQQVQVRDDKFATAVLAGVPCTAKYDPARGGYYLTTDPCAVVEVDGRTTVYHRSGTIRS